MCRRHETCHHANMKTCEHTRHVATTSIIYMIQTNSRHTALGSFLWARLVAHWSPMAWHFGWPAWRAWRSWRARRLVVSAFRLHGGLDTLVISRLISCCSWCAKPFCGQWLHARPCKEKGRKIVSVTCDDCRKGKVS